MYFQEIKDEYYGDNLINKLFELIPEFKSVADVDEGVYYFISELGKFVILNFDKPNIVEGLINFINYSLTIGGHETEDVLVIDLFPYFYDDDEKLRCIREGLKGNARSIFDKYYFKYLE